MPTDPLQRQSPGTDDVRPCYVCSQEKAVITENHSWLFDGEPVRVEFLATYQCTNESCTACPAYRKPVTL